MAKTQKYHTLRGRMTLGKVLTALQVPSNRTDISIVTGMSEGSVKTCLTILKRQGAIHCAGYKGVGNGASKLWVAGPGEDVSYEDSVGRMEMLLEPEVIEAFRQGASRKDISELLGLEETAAKRRISQVREVYGLHICDFREQPNTGASPVYKLGPGEDAVYKRKSRSFYRERAKMGMPAAPRASVTLAKRSHKRTARPVEADRDATVREVRVVKATTTGAAFRDPWSAALFGEYQGEAA